MSGNLPEVYLARRSETAWSLQQTGDIITQINAVKAALNRVEDEILRDHVSHCVEHAIASGNKADQRQKIAELIEVFGRAKR